MEAHSQVPTAPDVRSMVRQRKVAKTVSKGEKVECVFSDGSSILLSPFLASFIRFGDEIRFPLAIGSASADTEIYIRNGRSQSGRHDIYQAPIGYAAQPRKDKRGNLFVSVQVLNPHLGISAIHLRCETLRDYFYASNRRRTWDQQTTFYELLRASPQASLAELRVAFKLRALELRTARASSSDLFTLERAFNMLGHPESRACYDALLTDPFAPALFPHGGFGSLLVAGNLARDGATFYATRILSFLPERKHRYFRAPLRRLTFYSDHAIYRDSQRKLEVLFDQALVPASWDATWNQWKHNWERRSLSALRSCRAASIVAAGTSGSSFNGKPRYLAVSKLSFRRTLPTRSARRETPTIASVSLPMRLNASALALNPRQSSERRCRRCATTLESREISTSLKSPGGQITTPSSTASCVGELASFTSSDLSTSSTSKT